MLGEVATLNLREIICTLRKQISEVVEEELFGSHIIKWDLGGASTGAEARYVVA